jgi:Holliday junction resolvase RusA-like endonuclease
MLPPSTNKYVRHFESEGKQIHTKTPQVRAWERDFALFVRGQYVTGERFQATLRFRFGPGDGYDVDNLNKCALDCTAKAGVIRDPEGHWLSDRWFKKLIVEIHDTDQDRKLGQQTEIIVEAL